MPRRYSISEIADNKQHIGCSVPRREDQKLVTGAGTYVADIRLENVLEIAFVRSHLAGGKIIECDVSGALEMNGVAAGFNGKDVCGLGTLSVNPVLGEIDNSDYFILADGHVSAVGQPVAAILSKSHIIATDACESVFIDIDDVGEQPLVHPPASQPTKAPVPFEKKWRQGNPELAFEQASHIVAVDIRHPRLAPSPMENRAIAVQYGETTQSVTVYLSTQTPHRARNDLSKILTIDKARIRVIAPDVGGAFGMKASLYPEEVFAVWAAFRLKQSTRWISSRSEDLIAASHGRGLVTKASLALSSDGKILGLKATVRAPVGAWLPNSAAIPAWNAARILPGPYDISSYDISTCGARTNTAPVGIYRGAGRPEAAMLMERLVDKAARRLSMDPVELRRRNLINSDQLPFKRNTGVCLDSGDYPALLDLLCSCGEYEKAIQFRDKKRARGEIAGIGIGFFVEPCGTGWESATIRLNPDGTIVVFTGGSSQGHGRETAYAQIVADMLECELSHVSVHHGDTNSCPAGIGALASRSTAIGGSAVIKATNQVLEKSGGSRHPNETIEVSAIYECDGEAWGYGCYLAQVSIDAETGLLTIKKITCADDVGVIINPAMVEGQIRGGIAQGIGEAMMENLIYDETGQLITGSLMDYALPRADDIPNVYFTSMTTPSPMNLLGAKGIGEAGTIGAPAAILNAALDALAPLGVEELSMPLTSANLWQAIQNARISKTRPE